MARACEKPASTSGWTQASAPPTTTTSASPALIILNPQASASAPEAQAEIGECTPALAFRSGPTYAAGPLGASIGMVSGETLRSPAVSSRSSWCC